MVPITVPRVILRHVFAREGDPLLRELEQVAGNKSFEETVRSIRNEMVRQDRRVKERMR